MSQTSPGAPRAKDLLDVFGPTSAAAARIHPTTTELAAASALVAIGGEDAMDHRTAAAMLAGAAVLVYATTAWDGGVDPVPWTPTCCGPVRPRR